MVLPAVFIPKNYVLEENNKAKSFPCQIEIKMVLS